MTSQNHDHNIYFEDTPESKTKYFILAFLLLGLLGGGLAAFGPRILEKIQNLNSNSNTSEAPITRRPEPTSTSSALPSTSESTSSASLSSVTKEMLTISVLNGSRVPGQAGKVKDILVGGGFSKVSTDNADKGLNGGSIIRFGTAVPYTLQTQITDLLRGPLTKISNGDPLADQPFGVEITTGAL